MVFSALERWARWALSVKGSVPFLFVLFSFQMASCCSFSGFKDCGSFLQTQAVESFPLASSITHEGVFYQHYFDVPPTKEHTLKVSFSFSSPIIGRWFFRLWKGGLGGLFQ
mmetsp:Transcript_12031/g.15982  ORF Transcript_12031/g.15982 Transcript_12031/m.15982 type:complete len:111 (-) Transcript_12031:176-508(-)